MEQKMEQKNEAEIIITENNPAHTPGKLDRFFSITERNSNLKTEVIAGITTFLAMSYIIFVNPDILAHTGMDKSALILATALAAAFGTILTGLIAKVPIAMAPGMGLNAFFAYTLVITKGISWQTALGIVFLSGLIFFILSLIGAREKLVKAIPAPIIESVSVGIGLFIAFIGFKNMGLITENPATLVQLGTLNEPVLIGLAGLVLIVILELKKIKGSILIGIAFATITGILTGLVKMPTLDHLLNLNLNLTPLFMKMDIMGALKWSFIGSVFSLMFVDMFDSVGTIVACTKEANLADEEGNIKQLGPLLTLDAVATMTGALLGTSTTTSYVESATGIKEGGRTGLTAIVTGLLFLLAIPASTLIAIVPPFATAPALVIVGLFMITRIKDIDFTDLETSFPVFLTIILMPLTYSISTGLTFGFLSFTLIKILRGKIRSISWIMWIITALSLINLLTA